MTDILPSGLRILTDQHCVGNAGRVLRWQVGGAGRMFVWANY